MGANGSFIVTTVTHLDPEKAMPEGKAWYYNTVWSGPVRHGEAWPGLARLG